jgi:flagellar biosynthesis/type III secretory pathway M-ring protein FliF/YscJ
MMRRQMQPPPALPAVNGSPLAENALPLEDDSTDLMPAQRHQDNLRYAQGLAHDDPRMVAMLINDWMDKEKR